MIIQIPQGKSRLIYPSTNTVQLSDYNSDLEIVFLLSSTGDVQVYIPNEPLLTAFTTLNYNLSYDIVALKAFEIIA